MNADQTYANQANGGQEQIRTVDGVISIRSDFGRGWTDWMIVSRYRAAQCMAYTSATPHVVAAILGETK